MSSQTHSGRHVLITGADGFIGKNLVVRIKELEAFTVSTFVRGDDIAFLPRLVAQADDVFHLAGENRPANEAAFFEGNIALTKSVCGAIQREFEVRGRRVSLVFTSSVQAEYDTPYGRSKFRAEQIVQSLAQVTGNKCVVFRLPGVFGKWCRPNYNSVVATFCHNLSRGLPIHINDVSTCLQLAYVDDVVTSILNALESQVVGYKQLTVEPQYSVELGELASLIGAFVEGRKSLITERVGTGFLRALYATYISYLPKEKFAYHLAQHVDARGVFVEVLKTTDSGQFSYFTALPGVTRGGHYHHTKSEKFLVIKGEALFRFRHVLSNELVELRTSGTIPKVVDTIPGWAHDITNVGSDEMVVMLWANENFDEQKPDTVASKV